MEEDTRPQEPSRMREFSMNSARYSAARIDPARNPFGRKFASYTIVGLGALLFVLFSALLGLEIYAIASGQEETAVTSSVWVAPIGFGILVVLALLSIGTETHGE